MDKNSEIMESQFVNYTKLKKECNVEYKGFHLNNILSLKMWDFANDEKNHPSFLSSFIKCVSFTHLIKIDKQFVLYTDEPRKDHNRTFHDIAEKVRDKYYIIDESNGHKINWVFNLKNIIRGLKIVFENVKSISWQKKICLAAELCKVLNSIDNLLVIKNIPKINKFVVYSSVHQYQNLLGQYFRARGSNVIGLTHGSQFVYKHNIPIDCVNYENLIFDCIVWGNMTKKEYVNYGLSPNSIFVGGYPKKLQIGDINLNNPLKKCLVLLCRSKFELSNQKLLNKIQPLSAQYKFDIKLHPSCDILNYANFSKNGMNVLSNTVMLTDCMDSAKYDFAIAVNTTSYYEIMIAGIPCLRYEDSNSYDLTPGLDFDSFSTTSEFCKAMLKLKELVSSGEYDIIRKKTLMECIGLGIDNYRDILL